MPAPQTARHIVALSVAVGLAVLVSACPSSTKKSHARASSERIRWKAVIMTGDDSIDAFDNARETVREVWMERGIAARDVRELSMASAVNGVTQASKVHLERALQDLAVRRGEGCIVHLSSHGSPWGFYLRNEPALAPADLDALLDKYCGRNPTVVFVSACYSGIFTGNVMKRPHRAVFTAARDDRTSFGCGVENVYTFWDACLIDNLPRSTSWTNLGSRLDKCIRRKERREHLRFSYPQTFIGKIAATVALPASEDEP